MNEKLNIAEILKDCPKGMKLYSPLCGECELWGIIQGIIHVNTNSNKLMSFYSNGRYMQDGECVLFPSKENRDWSTFQRSFKDGDILATDLGSVFYLNTRLNTDERYGCYVGKGGDGSFHICEPFAYKECCDFATEEEKQKLFKTIEDNGYCWNAETKTLEKLIVPKFKVGDRVKHTSAYTSGIVVKVTDKGYYIDYPKGEGVCFISFTLEKDYELTPNKFDITTLKPFESNVLVRDYNSHSWKPAIFGFIKNENDNYKYYVVGGINYAQCIPYEGNELLLGTNNDCDNYYKTWK